MTGEARGFLRVGAAAMCVPAVLALVVFPTPMIDTRELLAWGPDMIGLQLTDTRRAHWYDPDRLASQGAVVVYRRSMPTRQVAEYLPTLDSARRRSLILPLRRTFSGKSVTYEYAFLPPTACGPPD